jgi:hypothetical protein
MYQDLKLSNYDLSNQVKYSKYILTPTRCIELHCYSKNIKIAKLVEKSIQMKGQESVENLYLIKFQQTKNEKI